MSQLSLEQWAKRLKLNPTSPTTLQLYANRQLTVAHYISGFRKGRILRVLPTEVLDMSVEEALTRKRVGKVNIRKLLESNRQKFKK